MLLKISPKMQLLFLLFSLCFANLFCLYLNTSYADLKVPFDMMGHQCDRVDGARKIKRFTKVDDLLAVEGIEVTNFSFMSPALFRQTTHTLNMPKGYICYRTSHLVYRWGVKRGVIRGKEMKKYSQRCRITHFCLGPV